MQPSPITETSRPLFPSSRFFMLKISQESGTQESRKPTSYFLIFTFYFLLRPCSLRFQRLHVDGETVLHIGLEQPLVGFVDLLNRNDFNIGGDVVFAANIEPEKLRRRTIRLNAGTSRGSAGAPTSVRLPLTPSKLRYALTS